MAIVSESSASEPVRDKVNIGMLEYEDEPVNPIRYGLYPFRFST